MLSLAYRGASADGQKRRLAGSFRLSVISQTLWRDASISPMDSIRTFGQALPILAILSATVDLCVGPVEAEGSGNLIWNRTNETTLLTTHAELPFSETISRCS
jgi:hypothetical protein